MFDEVLVQLRRKFRRHSKSLQRFNWDIPQCKMKALLKPATIDQRKSGFCTRIAQNHGHPHAKPQANEKISSSKRTIC